METNINIIIKTTSDNTGLEELEGATEAADQSTKKLDESQKKQGKTAKNSSKANAGLAGTFKSLAAQLLAVAAAYTSYNVLVKDAINLAGIQVKAENNLLNALNNRAKAAGKDSDLAKRQLASLKSLASAKQEDLGIGDESILQASRWFVSAGANIEQMERLIEVTADLSEATGTGLNESAKGLSRIFTNLSGSLEELRSKGVAFTDAEMEMIKHMDSTNQKAEAQEIVLKKLEGTFGGSAKAAVNAFGGDLKRLGNTFGDFQETLGMLWEGASAPAARDLKRTLEGLINVFSSTEAKQFVATLSGIGGAFQAFGSMTLGPVLDSLGQTFKNLVKDMSNFSKGLENAGSDSAIVVGVLAQGFSVVGSVIVGITNNVISLGKALGSLLTLNPVTIKNAFADLGETMVNSVANAGKEVAKLFDKEHLKKQGAAIGKAMSEASARNYNITIDKLNSTPGSWSVPEPNQSDIDASAKRTADLFSQKLKDYMKAHGTEISSNIAGVLDFTDAFSGVFTAGMSKEIENYDQQLADLEKRYASIYDTISAKQEALSAQEAAEAESKRERELLAMEEELERLSQRTDAYLSAEEKKKWRELQKNKETMKAEKEKAEAAEKLAQERAALDKKLALERANLEYAQSVADWENQKVSFEANKKQQLFSSSMAMIRAPIEGTLGILKAGAEGGPVGAAIMTGMVTGLIANVIGSAVQLASAANQSFDVPAPVKSFYTGGVVPLKEGNQFMIGGAMGMEERATVRGGNLYIDNAVTTRNLPQENQGLSITVQNMTVQTADPEDFAEQMKNLFRREQYL